MHEHDLDSFVICAICQEVVPDSDFDRDTHLCARCTSREKLRKTHAVARDKARNVFREMIKHSRPDSIMAPHISEVCAGVVREIGGMERFCEELVEDYRDARERSPGSATVVRFGETILRLVRDSSAMRETAPDAVNLTEDELAGEMISLIERVVQGRGPAQTEQDLVDIFLGETDGPEGPKTPERIGGGATESENGGTEVLPAD